MRESRASIAFDANGFSEPIPFDVAPSTRSIAIVVKGDPTKLYALSGFALADGIERVGLDPSAPFGEQMRKAYFTEQSGDMPGDLFQSIRLGTFTHVFPFAPDQTVPPGPATVRVVSDAPGTTAEVRILMPEDDGAHVLHLNLVRVSDTATIAPDPGFVRELRGTFAQAQLEVVIDETRTVSGTPYSKIETFTEPQEAPDSASAKLSLLVSPQTRSRALDVMIVDGLVPGVAGLSLGVPGPPDPDSYYWGVVVAAVPDDSLARVIAHEVAHFLGLQHVTNRGISGKVYEDPIPDTTSSAPNLMKDGVTITPGQAFVLSRSPLLTR